MLYIEVGGLILVGVCNLLLGFIVFSRGRTQSTNTLFLLISICLALWGLGIAAFLYTTNLVHAAIYANIYYAAALGIAFSLAAFTLYRTSKKPPPTIVISLVLLFLLYIGTIILLPRSILESVFFDGSFKSVKFNVAGQIVYSMVFIVLFFASVVRLARSLSNEQRLRRSQNKYIILGISSAGLVGLLFNLIMPWFGYYGQIWVGPLFSMLFVGFVSYAIIKHKLFDIRKAIARAMAYVITLSFFGLVYALVLFVLSGTLLTDQQIPVGQRLFFIILALLVAISFQPLKHYFDRITNKFFYRDAYDPEKFIDDLNTELIANIELEILLRRTCLVVEQNLKCERCIVVTRETSLEPLRIFSSEDARLSQVDLDSLGYELLKFGNKLIVADDLGDGHDKLKQTLSDNDIAVISPVFPGSADSQKRALAYLTLSSKKSGNMYGKEDLQIIKIISDELVIAIQNALRFEEIQGFAATLQAKVREATAELKAANQKLRELDASKDEFISMASHQLRTPLTSVKGYLSMVLEGDAGKLTAMQRKLLTQSFASSQRMVYLIADLLNVSRLKTGKFVLESKPTNLADVVESEVAQLTETAAARNLTLIYDKPAAFPTLMLDETKTRQVIMNFVDNAIYYTPANGRIEIVLQENDQSIELRVIDNGLGVPKHDQHQLFTKFYRAGNARKARPDGTGLGLFMAKKVIIAQGGSIIFSSQEGKGSIFGFTFAKAKLLAPDTPINKA